MSFGVSISPLTKAQTFSLPILPIKKPCSNTTFCLARFLKLGSFSFFAPMSQGVYSTIPKPTFE